MRVLVTWWSCVLISQCWKGWCIGPIELTVCEILKENWFAWCSFSLTLDFMSSCPIMASNIFLGISACSGSASASLLKETGEVWNQGQSLQSPSPGSYILYDDHYDNFFTWLEIKAVFWSQICCMTRIDLCNHPLKRCRRWHSRPWTSKKSLRQIISSTQCDSCSGGVVLFCSKFQESEDRQMVPFVKSCWILFWDAQKHFTCLYYSELDDACIFFQMQVKRYHLNPFNCFSVDS